jgi:hypothetical protein
MVHLLVWGGRIQNGTWRSRERRKYTTEAQETGFLRHFLEKSVSDQDN